MRPAANAPSTKSKPTSRASRTSAASTSTRQPHRRLTGRVDRLAQDRAGSAGGRARSAVAARRPRRRAPKTTSRIASVAAPYDAGQEDRDDDDRPELAGDAGAEHGARRAASASRPASARIGTSVPSAVVASAIAEQPPVGVERRAACSGVADRQPERERERPAARAARERRAAARASRPPRARRRRRGTRGRSSRGTSMYESASAQPSTCGADQDPEHDLDARPSAARAGGGRARGSPPSAEAASTRTSQLRFGCGTAAATAGTVLNRRSRG